MASPLAQFEIKKIIPIEMFGYDVSFTNSALAMSVTVLTIFIFMLIGLKDLRIVPSKTQTIIESSYEFIADMIGDNIGKDGMKYLSFVFTFSFYPDWQPTWNVPV